VCVRLCVCECVLSVCASECECVLSVGVCESVSV